MARTIAHVASGVLLGLLGAGGFYLYTGQLYMYGRIHPLAPSPTQSRRPPLPPPPNFKST